MKRIPIVVLVTVFVLLSAEICRTGTLRGWTDCDWGDDATDCNPCVNNVLFTIGSMRQFGEPIGFHMRGVDVSARYHIQSVQRLMGPFEDYMILPSSSGGDPGYGDFLVVRFESPCSGREGNRLRSNRLGGGSFETTAPDLDDGVVHYQQIITPNDTVYNHPGGLQIIGRRAIIAMEDWTPPPTLPGDNNRWLAKLVIYDLSDNTDPEHPILERTVHLNRRTVQCVCCAKLSDGRYLLIAKEGSELEFLISAQTYFSLEIAFIYADWWKSNSLQSEITEWVVVPQSFPRDLKGLWSVGKDSVFAVGRGGAVFSLIPDDSQSGTLLLEPGPNVTKADLYGVWGTTADYAFAVGDSGTIAHLQNGRWLNMESPTNKDLRAVWGSSEDNVLAVGAGGTIVRYNGERWLIMESPTDSNLEAVWGFSEEIIYAVGDQGTIIRYGGSSWEVVESPTALDLTGVWGTSGDDIFAVGEEGIILNTTGSVGWSQMESGTSANLNGVWGSSYENVFAVGEGGEILHYDGRRWSSMDTPIGSGLGLSAIGGELPGRITAVGDEGSMLNYTLTWPEHQSLNLITQCGDGQLYVAGMRGDIVGGEDWMDVYRLDMDEVTYEVTLTLVERRHFYCSYDGMSDQANFVKAAGLYVNPDGRLILYATNGDNDGPDETLCGLEFRSQFHPTSVPGPQGDPWGAPTLEADGWVELYSTYDESDRSLMIDFDDRLLQDYENLAYVEDFDNRATYVRWCLPVGVRCVLYDEPYYGAGDTEILAGTGEFDYTSLGDFNNKASSLRFEYLINGVWTPVDEFAPFYVQEGSASDGENCHGGMSLFQTQLIAGDTFVPEGKTLTAYSSSRVKFNGGKRIKANGMFDVLRRVTGHAPTKFVSYADTTRGMKVSGQLIMRNGGELKIH
ncbi:WD40/YVTN/BNR-like repeat-containing protein [Candidatus Eisenbacteria bacterium]|uniref:WD40/YVTN/BNR-like repeat-containing protein n=1 Tax=Eiseniibacteriota bacterium TaxID=2212470 RepID=A0ABV6YNS3_UNCEI